jgi:hypothetical protein
MADLGAVWKRSAAAERAIVNGSLLGLVLTASTAQASVGWAVPFPRNDIGDIGRRIADWAAGTVETVRAMIRTSARHSETEPRYYHPRRETFIEDAAMSREMYRL